MPHLPRRHVFALLGAACISLSAPFSMAEETTSWKQVIALTFVAYGKEEGGPKPASRQLQGPPLAALNASLATPEADKDTILREYLNQQLAMSGLPFTPLMQSDLDEAREGQGLTVGEVTLNVKSDSPVWGMRIELLLD